MKSGGHFLPMNRKEMEERGWDQADFVYVCGDAYVDHPSFGAAIITRVLEDAGYRVAFLSQPDWKDDASITVCGEPRLAFIVSSGNMDSMVNHYTSFKKRRHKDAYTPGGGYAKRPNHAVVVYSNLIRKTYKNTPLLIGGIEASLRRMGHYDYWSDSVRRSILLDSGADLLMYGMGERSVLEIAEALKEGRPVKEIRSVRGTVYRAASLDHLSGDYEILPSFSQITESRKDYAASYYRQYLNTDAITGHVLVEPYKTKEYVIQNPPAFPLTTEEMDHVYSLPYMRAWHPSYDQEGGVPALSEVIFSLASSRGCFGGCSFCALAFHQGRRIQARSHESIVKEAEELIRRPDFKGYIHDVGGPTADFRAPACKKQVTKGVCSGRQCLFPRPCPNLVADHTDYITLLRKLRKLPGVRKVFIRSGIRFDYVLEDKKTSFLTELCRYHVSGQLKVAPEHISDPVLYLMGKPENGVYEKFRNAYEKTNRKLDKKQYLVPYLMSSHPGSSLKEAVELAEYVRDLGYMPEQVQDFYPTPGTISTCMYYTGLDPRTMQKVYVPRTLKEKQMQRALIQYRDPANYDIVKKALEEAGRRDLIGYHNKCLIPPRKPAHDRTGAKAGGRDRTGARTAAPCRAGAKAGSRNRTVAKAGDHDRTGAKSGGRNRTGAKAAVPCQTGAKKKADRKGKTIRNTHKKKNR